MRYAILIFYALSTSMVHVPDAYVASQTCTPLEGKACIVEMSFLCPPGYLDGCITGETKKHRCVPADGGPDCSFEFELHCAPEFIDGCLTGETTQHFCAPTKKGLCLDSQKLSCPVGFVDSCVQ